MFSPKRDRWPLFFTILTLLTHYLTMVKVSEKCQCCKIFARTSLSKALKPTCVYWISAGKKSTSCWRTNWLHIVIIQNDSFCSQPVHVWGVDFWAMKSHITPSKIIHDYQQNMQRTTANLEYKCQQTQRQEHRHKQLFFCLFSPVSVQCNSK